MGWRRGVLTLPGDPTRFLVYIGCDDANRFAGGAHGHNESPRADLLIVRRNSALTRFETAAKFAQEGAPPPELEFDVERSSDPEYAWELWLDPVLAVDAEDQVPGFLAALHGLAGVTGVYHQDREQIQVAGKITQGTPRVHP